MKIDTVVLTHPHPDHMNGLKFILEEFPVKELWVTPQTVMSTAFEPLQRIIQEQGVPTELWYWGKEKAIAGADDRRSLQGRRPQRGIHGAQDRIRGARGAPCCGHRF